MESLVFDKPKVPISIKAIRNYFVGVISSWLFEKGHGDWRKQIERKELLVSPFTELKDDHDVIKGDQLIDKIKLFKFLTGEVSLFQLRETLPRFEEKLDRDKRVVMTTRTGRTITLPIDGFFSLREVMSKITDIGEDGFVMTPRTLDVEEVINESNLRWANKFYEGKSPSSFMLTMLKIRDYSSEPDLEVIKGLVQQRFSEWIHEVLPNRKWVELVPNKKRVFSTRERNGIGIYFQVDMPGYVYMTPFKVENVINPKRKKVKSILRMQIYSIRGKYVGIGGEIKIDKPMQVMFVSKGDFRRIFMEQNGFNTAVSDELGKILFSALIKSVGRIQEKYINAIMKSRW